MRGWVAPRRSGAVEGGMDVFSEIDHALAMIGVAHWTERRRPSAFHSRPRPPSVPPSANSPIGLRRLVVPDLFVTRGRRQILRLWSATRTRP